MKGLEAKCDLVKDKEKRVEAYLPGPGTLLVSCSLMSIHKHGKAPSLSLYAGRVHGSTGGGELFFQQQELLSGMAFHDDEISSSYFRNVHVVFPVLGTAASELWAPRLGLDAPMHFTHILL